MKLKALHYERHRDNSAEAYTTGACGIMGQTSDPRWTPEGIRDIVSYHQPSPSEIVKINPIRTATEMFIRAIFDNCPDCADRSAAIRHAREAMRNATASVVLDGRV